MAKMFYSIEETAERLGISVEEVRSMADQHKLQQFRDGAKVMFKRDQVEALAGGSGDSGEISLEEPTPSSDTDAIDLAEVAEKPPTDTAKSATATGISVFDADEVELTDPMAQTVVSGGMDSEAEDLVLESVGSGSGLLDLTRESDDTSLGAELLDEIYPAGSDAKNASGVGSIFDQAGGVESGAMAEAPAGRGTVNIVEAEVVDPVASGWTAGLLIGALVALVLTGLIVYTTLNNVSLELTGQFSQNLGVYAGGLFGLTVVLAIIGGFIGKAFKR